MEERKIGLIITPVPKQLRNEPLDVVDVISRLFRRIFG